MLLIEYYEVIHTMKFLLNILYSSEASYKFFLRQPTKQMSTNR